MALNANKQVIAVVANTLCCIQYYIYNATNMQLYATFLQLISMSNSHTHSNMVNKMPPWFFIHLSMDDVC
jgi:hypothetical protein